MIEGIRRVTRQLFGLAIYRMFATFFLLVAGFTAFPDHKAVFALAVIVFGTGIGGIIECVQAMHMIQSRMADLAERKTRHTILLAQERALRGESCDGYGFWSDVDARVDAEIGSEPPAPKWWQSIGLTTGNALGRLVSDLISIAIALMLSGNG
jgi:hypothetical protein